MNAYIIVEGDRTEAIVYPEWLKILAPNLEPVKHILDFKTNNYLLFRGGGIPSIYTHIANAAKDINRINSDTNSEYRIDYLMVCIDTEEESREYILGQIHQAFEKHGITELTFSLEVFEQKVCMESWFLGNSRIFKSNPQDATLNRYINHYNVRTHDPELMENIDSNEFTTKAQFHHSYLKKLFAEQHIRYSKSNPDEVCKEFYLNEIIKRHKTTRHLATFGRWYDFVIKRFSKL